MIGDDTCLAAQAALAEVIAPLRCTGHGCVDYHRAWPALRARGLVASPHRQAAWFATGLAAARPATVLLAGVADAGLLEVVLGAVGDGVAVTVLDRCPTPVEVALDAARRAGFDNVRGAFADLVAGGAAVPGGVDVVATHGLLGQVARADRPALAATLRAALRPGGTLLTTMSVAGPDAPPVVRFDDAAVQAMTAAAGPDLADRARAWARASRTHPFASSGEIAELLAGAGFDVAIDEVAATGAAAGPATARAATYALVTARAR